MLKVDLGGVGRNRDWITVNCDNSLRAAPDHLADITAATRELDALFGYQSIDKIRCIHTLEHLDAEQILPTLEYWRSLLKPGGELLIVVPSLGALALDYVDGKIPFDVFAAVAYVPPSRINGHEAERHRWGWDAATLRQDLERAGYNNVRPAGDEHWPRTWTLDFADLLHTGLVGNFEVQNLRMVATA